MVDYLKFIRSNTLKKYYDEINFNPTDIQKFVFIVMNESSSINERLIEIRNLLNETLDDNVKELCNKYINAFEESFGIFYKKDVSYRYSYVYYQNDAENQSVNYYLTFEEAYTQLQKDIGTNSIDGARINRIKIYTKDHMDDEERYYISFMRFDSNLKTIWIDTNFNVNDIGYNIGIPHPFKAGDIIKNLNDEYPKFNRIIACIDNPISEYGFNANDEFYSISPGLVCDNGSFIYEDSRLNFTEIESLDPNEYNIFPKMTDIENSTEDLMLELLKSVHKIYVGDKNYICHELEHINSIQHHLLIKNLLDTRIFGDMYGFGVSPLRLQNK